MPCLSHTSYSDTQLQPILTIAAATAAAAAAAALHPDHTRLPQHTIRYVNASSYGKTVADSGRIAVMKAEIMARGPLVASMYTEDVRACVLCFLLVYAVYFNTFFSVFYLEKSNN